MKLTIFKISVLAVVTVAGTAVAQSRNIGGKVMDNHGEPLPYANVVLLTLPDSAFVQGTITDDQGFFAFPEGKDGDLLKVSSIGYHTSCIAPDSALVVTLDEESLLLGEVVVKSALPKTRVKGDAMRTTIEGSILEKAGTVSDALSKVPSLEAERDGAVKVLGRGEAEVYINGRKVQDIKELSRLRSDQIQYVDVVQNPGAGYSASTKAVVRIRLKRAQGEGFSFQEYAQFYYQYGHTLTNNIDLNYRVGGLDITASFWCGRYGHTRSLQEIDLTYIVGDAHYLARSKQDTKNVWKGWSPQLQVNYMVNDNHTFGAYYKFDRHPSGSLSGRFDTDNFRDDVFTERSESYIVSGDTFRKHIFNAYYNGHVGKVSIDWNVDGLFDRTTDNNHTDEVTVDAESNRAEHAVNNVTESGNNFWATKLVIGYELLGGNLSVGGEYSHNHRTDAYVSHADQALPVKATDTEINESSTAAFIEYGRAFGKLFAQAGVRYEYLNNDYFDFGIRQDDVCRSYGDWFPSVSLSMPVGATQLSLSYRQDIQRPSYSNLTSSTIYINRYTYQSGNPYLKPTYTHSVVLNAAYRWMNLTFNYAHTVDNVTLATEPYPDADDPMVSLVRPINGSKGFSRVTLIASARPVVGCWHPTWTVALMMQNYRSPRADGSTILLNHPLANMSWNNDFELPWQLRLNLALRFMTHGDYDNFRVTRCQFTPMIGLQRDFNIGRLGQLAVDVRCYDPFNTGKNSTTIYGIREITSFNPSKRTFMIDLTWKFNEARSKYRGSGAGAQQKARM